MWVTLVLVVFALWRICVFYKHYESAKHTLSRFRRRLGFEYFVRGWRQREIEKRWPDGRYFHVNVDMVATGHGLPKDFVSACDELEEHFESVAKSAHSATADQIREMFDNLPQYPQVDVRHKAVTVAVPKVVIPANFHKD